MSLYNHGQNIWQKCHITPLPPISMLSAQHLLINTNVSSQLFFFKGGKPSGKEVRERRTKLESLVTAAFVQQEGYEVDRAVVLSRLELDEKDCVLVTRTIKNIFPMVRTRRNRAEGLYPL